MTQSTIINDYNLLVRRYTRKSYHASIINRGKSKRHIVCGVFTIEEIRQWKQVIKAFEKQIKTLK